MLHDRRILAFYGLILFLMCNFKIAHCIQCYSYPNLPDDKDTNTTQICTDKCCYNNQQVKANSCCSSSNSFSVNWWISIIIFTGVALFLLVLIAICGRVFKENSCLTGRNPTRRQRLNPRINTVANQRIVNDPHLFYVSDKPPSYESIYPYFNTVTSANSASTASTTSSTRSVPNRTNYTHILSINRMLHPSITRIDG